MQKLSLNKFFIQYQIWRLLILAFSDTLINHFFILKCILIEVPDVPFWLVFVVIFVNRMSSQGWLKWIKITITIEAHRPINENIFNIFCCLHSFLDFSLFIATVIYVHEQLTECLLLLIVIIHFGNMYFLYLFISTLLTIYYVIVLLL